MGPAMIISTYPDKKTASRIASGLVSEGAASCVNIVRISSTYMWKGKIENATEYLALFKTVTGNRGRLKKAIRETHPYDVPEIAEIGVASVNAPYLRWLESTSRTAAGPRPRRAR